MENIQLIHKVLNGLECLERRYNPENDCSPSYPTVNYTDHQLIKYFMAILEVLKELINDVEFIKGQLIGSDDPNQMKEDEVILNRLEFAVGKSQENSEDLEAMGL